MEQYYYFIEKDGKKQGPLTKSELKNQTILTTCLVWRSDSDKWKKASEFEELKDAIFAPPPPTPKEQKQASINKKFVNSTLKPIILVYFGITLLVTVISFSIAKSSWQQYLDTTGRKYLHNNYSGTYLSSGTITLKERQDNNRYKYYNPDIDNEEYAAMNQNFLFRSFKAFGSIIYITKAEQEDSSLLFYHLFLSSLVSLLLIFFPLTILIYVSQLGTASTG